MKTRKVGKIVSLLVAIVLVATIMIPAAGVLAAETPDRTVASNAELHSAIQFAYEKSLAGEITADRPYRVQLSGDIEVPTFGYTAIGTSYLDGREEWSRRGYIAAKTFVKDGVTYTNYQQEGSYEGTAIIIPENTYMVIDLNGHTIKLADAYQYGDKNKEEIGIANPEYNQVTYTNGALDKSESLHPKGKGRTQDIIYKNGMASVITVLGQLTLKDTSSKKTGTITGGVGNVVEAGDRGSAVGKNIQALMPTLRQFMCLTMLRPVFIIPETVLLALPAAESMSRVKMLFSTWRAAISPRIFPGPVRRQTLHSKESICLLRSAAALQLKTVQPLT